MNAPDGSVSPAAPTREALDVWEHSRLYRDVRDAIACLPVYFRTETHISGIMATDLHTLNTVLGATIEEQVVRTLNLIRNTWDPDEKYSLYHFVRQAQTFPDVLLRRVSTGEVLLGIELKGWYLLAVESARYAAAYRNYHWRHVRRTKQPAGIEAPRGITPYPDKSDQILDKPLVDGGGNFGRLARTGMMDTYMKKLDDLQLCGINTVYWREFLKIFQEGATDAQARTALERLRRQVRKAGHVPSARVHSTLAIIAEIERLLDPADAVE